MLSWLKRRKNNALCGFAFTSQGLAAAQITRDREQTPTLAQCQFFSHADTDARAPALRTAIRALNAERQPMSAVIDPNSYQLLLVEAPDVPADELRGAVRWRIKDLINFHIDDAVIDVFDVPGQHSTGAGGRLTYAVVAHQKAVDTCVRNHQTAGGELKTIDIPEMSLRNIAALSPQDEDGVALLYLAHSYSLILLCRQGTLYLSRRIEVGYAQLQAADGMQFEASAGDIILELQRSRDYYERHYAQSPISHTLVAPTPEPTDRFLSFLDEHTDGRISRLDLNTLLTCSETYDAALQSQCITAIGAALRVEAKAL